MHPSWVSNNRRNTPPSNTLEQTAHKTLNARDREIFKTGKEANTRYKNKQREIDQT